MPLMFAVLVAALSYLLGSVVMGVLYSRARGADIRERDLPGGSGTYRQYGLGAALLRRVQALAGSVQPLLAPLGQGLAPLPQAQGVLQAGRPGLQLGDDAHQLLPRLLIAQALHRSELLLRALLRLVILLAHLLILSAEPPLRAAHLLLLCVAFPPPVFSAETFSSVVALTVEVKEPAASRTRTSSPELSCRASRMTCPSGL